MGTKAKQNIYEVLKAHEGVVPHLYVDTTGNITCGVGFLVPSWKDVAQYAWDNQQEATADYRYLAEQLRLFPKDFIGRPMKFYKERTTARLKSVDEQLARKIAQFERLLSEHGLKVTGMPWQAYQVTIDLVYQVGVAGLINNFPSYCAAIARADWARAAKECSVKQAGKERNEWRNTTLLQLTTVPDHQVCPHCGR